MALGHRQLLASFVALATRGTHHLGPIRRAAIWAVGHHRNLGQQPRQPAHSCRLGGAFLATDQHPADTWVDRVQNQRALKALLAYQGAKWINWSSVRHRPYSHA